MTIYPLNARSLSSDVPITDLIVQARTIAYDVIGLTKTRMEKYCSTTVEQLVESCPRRQELITKIDSFEQKTSESNVFHRVDVD